MIPGSLANWNRWHSRAAIGLTLLAFAGVVFWGHGRVRQQARQTLNHVIERDASVLYLLALGKMEAAATDGESMTNGTAMADVALVTLEIAEPGELIGLRVFDTNGGCVMALPEGIREDDLDQAKLARVRQPGASGKLQAFGELHRNVPRRDLFATADPGARFSWVELIVPLHPPGKANELLGVAQFAQEGATIAREFALLDRRLALQSAGVLAVGALVIVGGLGWAFQKLERANRLLTLRTEDLQRANQELAQAAKASALGAVTAHLIHSLKNPVAGLHSFVASRQEQADHAAGDEWREAIATTRRMQSLIHQVVEVLREQEGETAYELPLPEVGTQVARDARPLAERKGVRLELNASDAAGVDNRVAGLLRLILANLVQNAIEATAPGTRVELSLRAERDAVVCEVRDEGAGLPEMVKARLFEPVRSSKEGGSGIGLAISRQLAGHLGADLALISSSERGTVFRVSVPRKRASG